MTGDEVKAIFEPVIEVRSQPLFHVPPVQSLKLHQEVIELVLGQIEATSNAVSAVLLVGGFGQSAYLRDQIRAAVGDIEVMQSPNGYWIFLANICTHVLTLHSWIAVVRGALMKGLASTSLNFATVRVSGRSARKHYGIHSQKPFDITKHEASRKYVWSSFGVSNKNNC